MGSAHLRDVTIERTLLAQGCGWQVSDATFRATSAGSRFESRHDGVDFRDFLETCSLTETQGERTTCAPTKGTANEASHWSS